MLLKFALLLLHLLWVLVAVVSLQWTIRQKCRNTRPSNLHMTSVGRTLPGSDFLERPDDEKSPEFQIYLKKLIEMQSNRARNGYSAPSSASSDMYLANLNRIKLERKAREMAELSYDRRQVAGSRSKDYLQQFGDEKKEPSTNIPSSSINSSTRIEHQEFDEIEMDKQTIRSDNFNKVNPVRLEAGEKQPAETIQRANYPKEIIANSLNIDCTSGGTDLKVREVKSKRLSNEQLNLVGGSLQLLIKHRGGGPFGPGRLQGDDIDSLKSSITKVINLFTDELQHEIQQTQNAVDTANKKSIKGKEKLEAIVSSATNEIRTIKVKDSMPTSNPNVSKNMKIQLTNKEDAILRPLALGLDQYLTNPLSLSHQELCALRDGIIAVLAKIPMDISLSQKGNETSEKVSATTERIISSYYGHGSDDESTTAGKLKVALGLLLKHQGGRGLGHGRLQRNELTMLENSLEEVMNIMASEIAETAMA